MRKDVMMLGAGILLGLSFHASFFIFLVFLALPIYIRSMLDERRLKDSLKLQFIFSLSYHLVGFCWIFSASNLDHFGESVLLRLIILFVAWFGMAIYLTIPYLLIPIVLNGFKQKATIRLALMITTYSLVEFLMEFTSIGFPWFRLGLICAHSNEGLYLASIGGVYLCTIVVLLASYGLLHLYLHKRSFALLAFIVLISFFNPSSPIIEDGLKVSLIQSNINTSEKWDREFERINDERQMDLIKQADGIIFMPESVVVDERSLLNQYINDSKKEIYYGAIIERNNEFYNVLLSNSSDNIYAKRHLVPIGEYVPRLLGDLLPVFNDFNLGSDLSSGSGVNLFESEELRIGGLICFESIYPALVSKSVRNGANLLYIASNDAWFNENEMYQHQLHAIMRSAENQRSLIRVGNTGYTFTTNHNGEVCFKTKANEASVLAAEVSLNDRASIYNLFGRFMPYVALLYVLSSLSEFKYSEWILLTGGSK